MLKPDIFSNFLFYKIEFIRALIKLNQGNKKIKYLYYYVIIYNNNYNLKAIIYELAKKIPLLNKNKNISNSGERYFPIVNTPVFNTPVFNTPIITIPIIITRTTPIKYKYSRPPK